MSVLRRALSRAAHEFSIRAFGESRRTFQPLPPSVGVPSWSAIQTYCFRPDIQAVYPLGLTPAGRGAFLRWCSQHGATWGATYERAAAELAMLDATPSRGLALTYRFRPQWQRLFPLALTAEWHWRELCDWIAWEFNCGGRWLKRAMLGNSDIELSVDVTLIARWRQVCGLQVEATEYAAALAEGGSTVGKRAVPTNPLHGIAGEFTQTALESGSITIVKAGAFEPFDSTFDGCGLHPREGVYRIAAWSWELEDLPAQVLQQTSLVQEFWTPSEFSAIGLRKHAVAQPIYAMRPSVNVPAPSTLTRTDFGLLGDECVFLSIFDLSGMLERKNPLGAIAAFRRAFSTLDRARLVLKINRAESYPRELEAIRTAASGSSITVLTGTMPGCDLAALLRCSDSLVSLHRSEGFGYTLAEAMLLGKPVIATNYSANAEYMTPDNSLPVNFDMVKIELDIGVYSAGSRWAEPQIDHAAMQMRWVFQHRHAAQEIGKRASRDAHAMFSRAAFARRLQARLQQIRLASPRRIRSLRQT